MLTEEGYSQKGKNYLRLGWLSFSFLFHISNNVAYFSAEPFANHRRFYT